MYKYYDMKLVTFGIDQDRNLIIQFPVFVQPYTQKPLTLYQIETIPVLILDTNEKADSYTWIKIDKLYIALNPDTYISIRMEELRTCKRIGYEYFVRNYLWLTVKQNIVAQVLCISNWIDKR